MLRGFTVSRGSFQKDGVTLQQSTMIRYVESTFPVVRSIMEARLPDLPPEEPQVVPPRPPADVPKPPPAGTIPLNWGDDSLVFRLSSFVILVIFFGALAIFILLVF